MSAYRCCGALLRVLACVLTLAAITSSTSADQITTDARSIWRDYSTDGAPTSGVWNPRKGEMRAWGALVGSSIVALQASQAAGPLAFDTKANLNASLAYAANTMAFVFADGTSSNNGVYSKVGASGSGSWSKVSTLVYGPQPTFTLGTVTRTACNTDPTASVSGTALAPTLNFSLPDCDIDITVGTVSTTTCGTSPIVTKSGENWAPVFGFSFPDCSAALGGLAYKGTWNASTNLPSLSGGSGSVGDYYIVATAGSTNLSGVSTWAIGDWLIRYSSGWQRLQLSTIANAEYATKSAFVSALSSIAGAAAGQSVRVRSVVTPGSGYGTCGLTYVAAASSTGVYGEVSGAGLYWQPQYSTAPVEACQFGAIGDAVYSNSGASFTATASGSSTITVSSKTGLAVGQQCASVHWHSDASAKLTSVATINSIHPSLNQITLSASVASGSNILLACWNPLSTISGTDNCTALHGAMDYALVNGLAAVHLPVGKYKTSCGLDLGYGISGFATLNLVSDAPAYNGDLPGAVIYSLDATRPGICVQGLRNSHVENITLIGPNFGFGQYAATYHNYGATYAVTPSSDPLDYLAPNLVATSTTPGGLQLHSPLAGFAIDCRSGSAPTAPYADAPFPSGLYSGSPPAQYSKNYSSDVKFVGGQVQGFGVQVIVGANTDSQGDFVRVEDATVAFGPYGVVIANTQGRNSRMVSVIGLGLHTAYSNTALGQQHGQWNSTITNASAAYIYQWLDFSDLANSGSVTLENSYCEVCVRIGKWYATSTNNSTLTFRGGAFAGISSEITRQIPTALIETLNEASIVFDEGYKLIPPGLSMPTLVSGQANLDLRNAKFVGMTAYTGGSAAIGKAIDYTGGISVGPPIFNISGLRTASFGRVAGSRCNSGVTSCSDTRTLSADLRAYGVADYRMPMTQAATGFRELPTGKHWNFELPNFGYLPLDNTSYVPSGGEPSWSSCDVVTMKLKATAVTSDPRVAAAIVTGTLLYHYQEAYNLVVTAVSGPDGSGDYTLTLKQLNGMAVNFDGSCLAATHFGTSGAYFVVVPTPTVWTQVFYCTFTSGSTSVTGCVRGNDGYAGYIESYISVSDRLWGAAQSDSSYSPHPIGDNKVNTVATRTNGSPATMTLGANADASCSHCPVFPFKLIGGR